MLMPITKPTRSNLAKVTCSVLGFCLRQSFAVRAQNQGMANTCTGQDLNQLSVLDKFDLTVSGWIARSETRYDMTCGLRPVQNQTRQDQLLIAVDRVLRF